MNFKCKQTDEVKTGTELVKINDLLDDMKKQIKSLQAENRKLKAFKEHVGFILDERIYHFIEKETEKDLELELERK